MKIMSNSQVSNVIMLFVIIFMSLLLYDSGLNNKSLEQLNQAKDDTLAIVFNKQGQQVASISILMGQRNDLLKLNASKDIALLKLQKLVENQKRIISATVLSSTTKNNGTSVTTLTGSSDTIRKDSLIYIYPEYSTSFNDKWREVKILAGKDSIQWDVINYNEFQIVQRYERNGLFKPKTGIIEVTNLNPYTKTTELKTFTVKPPKQKAAFFTGTVVGAAIIIALSFIL